MKILAIGPLPPPLHGQSLADKMAFEALAKTDKVRVIDSTIDREFVGDKLPPVWSPRRLAQIVRILCRDWTALWLHGYDVIYISSGVSFRTMMRFFPYIVTAIVRRTPYVLHTHAATLLDNYMRETRFKKALMRYMVNHAASLIVLGDKLANQAKRIADPWRVSVCANGVDDTLFLSDEEFNAKLTTSETKRILFLSNLMEAKGIMEMLDAFEKLNDSYTLALAGAIENERVREALERVCAASPERVRYEGVVRGEKKRSLLKDSDILVLPSKNEGQGIVILEAYAAGCAVVTDPTVGGIGDIFKDKINGTACDHRSPYSIATSIMECAVKMDVYKKNNRTESVKYTTAAFCDRVRFILKRAAEKKRRQ